MIEIAPTNLIMSYLLANTPAYLYRALRDDDYLVRLMENATIEELADFVRSGNPADPDERDVVTKYAALIALVERRAPLSTIAACADRSGLDWAPDIVALALSTLVSSTSTTFAAPPNTGANAVATSAASNSRLVFTNSATFG